jgi:hypothetical protein
MPKIQNEMQEVKIGFYRYNQFPKVIDAMNCLNIRIQSPNSNIGKQFKNRKAYFSFNV